MNGGVSALLATMISPLGRLLAAFGGAKHISSARNVPPVEMVCVRRAAVLKTFTVLQLSPSPPHAVLNVGPSPTQSSLPAARLGLLRVRIPLGPEQEFACPPHAAAATLPAKFPKTLNVGGFTWIGMTSTDAFERSASK